jgi:hypothetical protein
MPSSDWLNRRYSPGVNIIWRDQRTEKLSAGSPGAGEPLPQLKSMIRSLRASTGPPARFTLFQYSPIQSGNVICPARSQRNATRARPVFS